MHTADIVVIAAYFMAMIAIGIWYARSMKSADMYFAGGRQLSWWMGGVSLVMSYVSALSIVVYAGLGYRYGLVALTLYWVNIPATLITTLLFARRWRRAEVITPTEFLERRFSPLVRQVFAWSGVPLKVIDEGLKIVAVGIFVSAGLKISAWSSMLCVGLTIILYAAMGGLWAVVVADFIQFVLVAGSVILLLPLAFRAAGGWVHLRATLPHQTLAAVHQPFGWLYIGAFFVLNTMSLAGNWSLIQKFYSARSDREARQIGWLASVLFFVLPPFWILAGIVGRGLISPDGIDPETIYARLSSALLPPGMVGLMMAALLAATMSVLSCGYNVISSVLTMDVYKRLIRPDALQNEVVMVGRILTIAVGTAALIIALSVAHFHWTIFDTMVTAYGLLLPPVVLPMLAGLLTQRLAARGALVGFVVGIVIGLGFLLARLKLNPAPFGVFDSLSLLVPAFGTALALLLAAIYMPATGRSVATTSEFFAILQRPAVELKNEISSPSPIAGLVIGLMGLVLVAVGAGVIPKCEANLMPVGVGIGFFVVGLAMIYVPNWWARRKVALPNNDRVNRVLKQK
jgi:solute:Na+ symporter, SSS family